MKKYSVEFLDRDRNVLLALNVKANYESQAENRAVFLLIDLAGMEIDYAVEANNKYDDIRVKLLSTDK